MTLSLFVSFAETTTTTTTTARAGGEGGTVAASLITDWWHPLGMAGLQTTLSAAVTLLIDRPLRSSHFNDEDIVNPERRMGHISFARLFYIKRLPFCKWIDLVRFSLKTERDSIGLNRKTKIINECLSFNYKERRVNNYFVTQKKIISKHLLFEKKLKQAIKF